MIETAIEVLFSVFPPAFGKKTSIALTVTKVDVSMKNISNKKTELSNNTLKIKNLETEIAKIAFIEIWSEKKLLYGEVYKQINKSNQLLNEINFEKVIPNHSISIKSGGIIPLGEEKNSWIFKQLQLIADRYHFKLSDPIKSIPEEALQIILNGGNEKFEKRAKSQSNKLNEALLKATRAAYERSKKLGSEFN